VISVLPKLLGFRDRLDSFPQNNNKAEKIFKNCVLRIQQGFTTFLGIPFMMPFLRRTAAYQLLNRGQSMFHEKVRPFSNSKFNFGFSL
jgi:hypothetical protein